MSSDDFDDQVCGCYYTTGSEYWSLKRHYLPQVQLKSQTIINPVCFTTVLTQTFHNPNTDALPQVRYTFSLYDGVAVNGYTIHYAGKTLKGIVKQKDVARKTYQAAVARGETAGLLDQLPAGVFAVTLGNVPAKAEIVVEVTYCGELKHDAEVDGLRFTLPTSIAPRYGEYPGEVLKSNATAVAGKKAGGIGITVDVDMAGSSAIRRVQSPSHPIAVSMGALSTANNAATDAPFMPSQASATLTLGTAELDADFVLQVVIDDLSKPQAILETHPTLPNHRAIMTTLVPKFTLEPAYPEIVFIADQSGSMCGSKNDALVSALKVFLKSLPVGVRFNICAFGNNFRFLWPKSQAYNEGNVQTAMDFVDTFTASYGGTEILKPITAAFEKHLSDLPLEVMLLTDGEIWAEEAVFSYINEQVRGEKKVDARVFALGIGSDVSHSLVEGAARAGNGFAQFVTQSEETDRKVVRMLKGALYGHTGDYKLEVHYGGDDVARRDEMGEGEEDFEIVEKVAECLKINDTATDGDAEKEKVPKSFFDPKDAEEAKLSTGDEAKARDRYAHLTAIDTPKLLQAPSNIPPLFPFNRTTLYVLLGPESAQKTVTSVTLRASSAEGPLELNIPVRQAGNTTGVPTIHQLATRKAIQDLEEGRGWLQAATVKDAGEGKDGLVEVKKKYESRFDEIVEREAVRLGEKFQVAGKWTSFVAVEDHTRVWQDDDVEAHSPPVEMLGVAAPSLRSSGSGGGAKKRMSSASSSSANKMLMLGGTPPFGVSSRGRGAATGSALFGGGYGMQQQQQVGHQFPPLGSSRSVQPAQPMSLGASAAFITAECEEDESDEDVDSGSFDDRPSTPATMASAYTASLSPPARSNRTVMQPARKSTGGKALPRRQLASKACRKSGANADRLTISERAETMHTLIALQKFSGAWAWNDELFDALEIDASHVELEGCGSDEAKATALVVAYLETKVEEKKDVWEMVVAKARAWLGKLMGVDGKGLDEVVREAAEYL